MHTQVIHMRNAPNGWQEDNRFVYIGRPNPKYDIEGRWGNPIYLPYNVDETERNRILDECDAILDGQLQYLSFREHVRRLHGRILVCFCKPKRCHGDHLALCADQLQAEHERVLLESKEGFSKLTNAKSLEEQEYSRRMETKRAFHKKIEEAKEGFESILEGVDLTDNTPIGMPEWFKRWRREYLDPAFALDKKNQPQEYCTVNDKVRYNYYQYIPPFYGSEED